MTRYSLTSAVPTKLKEQVEDLVESIRDAKQIEYGEGTTTLQRISQLTGIPVENCVNVLVAKHIAALELHEETGKLFPEEVVEKWVDIEIYRQLQDELIK